MPSCVAEGCKNRDELLFRNAGVTFHTFPHHNPERLRQWVTNVKRHGWSPTARSRLCSDHFLPECFERQGFQVRLKKDAIPTIFTFPNTLMKDMPSSEVIQIKQENMECDSVDDAEDDEHFKYENFVDVKVEEVDPLDIPSTSDTFTYEDIPTKRPRLESHEGMPETETSQCDNMVTDKLPSTDEIDVKEEEIDMVTSVAGVHPFESSELMRSIDTQRKPKTYPASKKSSGVTLHNKINTQDMYDVYGSHVAKSLREMKDEVSFRQVKLMINSILLEAKTGRFSNSNTSQKTIMLPMNNRQIMLVPKSIQTPLSSSNSQMLLLANASQTPSVSNKTTRLLLPSTGNPQNPLIGTSARSPLICLSMASGQLSQKPAKPDTKK